MFPVAQSTVSKIPAMPSPTASTAERNNIKHTFIDKINNCENNSTSFTHALSPINKTVQKSTECFLSKYYRAEELIRDGMNWLKAANTVGIEDCSLGNGSTDFHSNHTRDTTVYKELQNLYLDEIFPERLSEKIKKGPDINLGTIAQKECITDPVILNKMGQIYFEKLNEMNFFDEPMKSRKSCQEIADMHGVKSDKFNNSIEKKYLDVLSRCADKDFLNGAQRGQFISKLGLCDDHVLNKLDEIKINHPTEKKFTTPFSGACNAMNAGHKKSWQDIIKTYGVLSSKNIKKIEDMAFKAAGNAILNDNITAENAIKEWNITQSKYKNQLLNIAHEKTKPKHEDTSTSKTDHEKEKEVLNILGKTRFSDKNFGQSERICIRKGITDKDFISRLNLSELKNRLSPNNLTMNSLMEMSRKADKLTMNKEDESTFRETLAYRYMYGRPSNYSSHRILADKLQDCLHSPIEKNIHLKWREDAKELKLNDKEINEIESYVVSYISKKEISIYYSHPLERPIIDRNEALALREEKFKQLSHDIKSKDNLDKLKNHIMRLS